MRARTWRFRSSPGLSGASTGQLGEISMSDIDSLAEVGALRIGRRVFLALTVGALTAAGHPSAHADEAMEGRIREFVPALEEYIQNGMKAFDNPGLAIGIVTGDKLVYAKGFGVRSKGG